MGADEWHDPHEILPVQFRQRYGDSETVADALRRAEARPSTTDPSERSCCPECYSIAITPKAPSMHVEQRRKGAWECSECHNHFDDPLDMNPNATAFDWIDPDEISDPDERAPLEGPISDLGDEWLRKLAIALYRPWTDDGPSYRDLGALFPYSHYWIGDRVREWKDGEHRNLVPAPTADPDPITVDDAPAASSAAVATDGGRRRWDAYGG
jgi:hypothetical protein